MSNMKKTISCFLLYILLFSFVGDTLAYGFQEKLEPHTATTETSLTPFDITLSQSVLRSWETLNLSLKSNGQDFYHAELTFVNENGDLLESTLYQHENEEELRGSLSISSESKSGKYRLSRVQIRDTQFQVMEYTGNPEHVSETVHYLDFSKYVFEVKGTADYKYNYSLHRTETELEGQHKFEFTMDLNEDFLNVDVIDLYYLLDGKNDLMDVKRGEFFTVRLYKSEGQKYIGESVVPRNQVAGDYSLYSISGLKELQNSDSNTYTSDFSIYNENLVDSVYSSTDDFSGYGVRIQNTLGGIVPEFEIRSKQPMYSAEERIELDFSVLDPRFKSENIYVEVVNIDDVDFTYHFTLNLDSNSGSYKTAPYEYAENLKNGAYVIKSITYNMSNEYFEFYNSKYTDENQGGLSFVSEEIIFSVTNSMKGYLPEFEISVTPHSATKNDTITMDLTYENTQVNLTFVSLEYIYKDPKNPEVDNKKVLILERISETQFRTVIDVEDYMNSGEYQLNKITLAGKSLIDRHYHEYIVDKRRNGDTYNTRDLSAGDYQIINTAGDSELPVLKNLVVPEKIYALENIEILVEAEDLGSGIKKGSVSVLNDHGYSDTYSLTMKDGMLKAEFYVPHKKSEKLVITDVTLEDQAGNLITYYHPDYAPAYGNVHLIKDVVLEYPILIRPYEGDIKITLQNPLVSPGNYSQLYISLNPFIDAEVTANYRTPYGGSITKTFYRQYDKNRYQSLIVHHYGDQEGTYVMESLRISSAEGTIFVHHGIEGKDGTMDLSSGNYTVQHTKNDLENPTLEKLTVGIKNLGDDRDSRQPISVYTSDDISGVQDVEVELYNELQEKTKIINLQRKLGNFFAKEVYFEPSDHGKWDVVKVTLHDYSGKKTLYHDIRYPEGESEGSIPFDFSDGSFQVHYGSVDDQAPKILESKLMKNSVHLNEQFEYRIKAEDNSNSEGTVAITLENERGIEFVLSESRVFNGKDFVISGLPIETERLWDVGHYRAKSISIYDSNGNSEVVYDQRNVDAEIEGQDLSHLDLTVTEVFKADMTGYFDGISVSSNEIKANEKAEIKVIPGVRLSEILHISVFYTAFFHFENMDQVVSLKKNESGEYVGAFYPRGISGEFEARKIRVVTQRGTFDFYSDIHPLGFEVLDLEGLNINVLYDFIDDGSGLEPETFDRNLLSQISIDDGIFKPGDKVGIDLGFDFEEHGVEIVEISFRANGEYSSKVVTAYGSYSVYPVRDKDKEGLYEIDNIRVHTKTNTFYFYNKKYHAYEDESTMTFEEFFEVSNKVTDVDPPIITGIVPESKLVQRGESVQFTVKVQDESLLSSGSLTLKHQDESTEEIRLYPVSEGTLQGTWHVDLALSQGVWTPYMIEVTDLYGNSDRVFDMHSLGWTPTEQLRDLSSGSVIVSTNVMKDTEAPILKAIETMEMDGRHFVRIQADDASGLCDVVLKYKHDDHIYEVYQPAVRLDGSYYVSITDYVRQYQGDFELVSLFLKDFAGNGIQYHHLASQHTLNNADLSGGDFEALNTEETDTLHFENIVISTDQGYTPGEVILSMDSTIDTSMYQNGQASFVNIETGESFMLYMSKASNGYFEFRSYEQPNVSKGEYVLNSMVLHGEYDEYSLIVVGFSEIYQYRTKVKFYDFSDVTVSISEDRPAVENAPIDVHGVRVYKKGEEPSSVTPVIRPHDTMVVEFMLESEKKVTGIALQFAASDYERIQMGGELTEIQEGLYRIEIPMNEFYSDGFYEFEGFSVNFDEDSYGGSYYAQEIPYGFGNYAREIRVEGFGSDKSKPMLKEVSVDKRVVSQGGAVVYTFQTSDDLSGTELVEGYVQGVFTGHRIHFGAFARNEEVRATVSLSHAPADVYLLTGVMVHDKAGNSAEYKNKATTEYGYNVIRADFEHATVKVIDSEEREPSLKYSTHVEGKGWLTPVKDGEMSGSLDQGLRLEGLKVQVEDANDLGVEYSTHVQNKGWMPFVKDGEMSGTEGQSLRVEAVKLQLTGEEASLYDIYYRVNVQSLGWLGWTKNGEEAGSSGYGYRMEAIEIRLVKKDSEDKPVVGDSFKEKVKPSIQYRTHVQNVGWQEYAQNGGMSGTTGRGLRLEGLEVKVSGAENVGIRYSTHVQNKGWLTYVEDGKMSGTSGQSLRLEAVKLELTGSEKHLYDVYYRVHAEGFGWLDWAKNGMAAGTAGYGYRLEAIEILVLEKNQVAPGNTKIPYQSKKDSHAVRYQTHVQNVGWQEYVGDGAMSGTSGRSLRLEGIRIAAGEHLPSGSIEYTTHVQNKGWLPKVTDNAMSGTSGESLRLEAIRVNLTGELAQQYDVYYRVHAQNVGWMDWAKNGADAGTAGYAYRLEGIEVVMVPKGGAAPGGTARPFIQK